MEKQINQIDWEQRRYEIAKEIMAVAYNLYFTNKDYEIIVEDMVNEEHSEFLDVVAEYSIEQADALIKKLQNGKI